jgi:hypothetical protein
MIISSEEERYNTKAQGLPAVSKVFPRSNANQAARVRKWYNISLAMCTPCNMHVTNLCAKCP